jgi:hypothetical protein
MAIAYMTLSSRNLEILAVLITLLVLIVLLLLLLVNVFLVLGLLMVSKIVMVVEMNFIVLVVFVVVILVMDVLLVAQSTNRSSILCENSVSMIVHCTFFSSQDIRHKYKFARKMEQYFQFPATSTNAIH